MCDTFLCLSSIYIYIYICDVSHAYWVQCRSLHSSEDAEWRSRNCTASVPRGRGLSPGKRRPRINVTIAALGRGGAVILLLSQRGLVWHPWNYCNKPPSLPDFRWEESMNLSSLTLGKEEKVSSRAATIINRPDGLLNKAVLVGMFSWIKYHVCRSVKWSCVYVACRITTAWATSHGSGGSQLGNKALVSGSARLLFD